MNPIILHAVALASSMLLAVPADMNMGGGQDAIDITLNEPSTIGRVSIEKCPWTGFGLATMTIYGSDDFGLPDEPIATAQSYAPINWIVWPYVPHQWMTFDFGAVDVPRRFYLEVRGIDWRTTLAPCPTDTICYTRRVDGSWSICPDGSTVLGLPPLAHVMQIESPSAATLPFAR